jgi:hypothetical protein
MAFTVCFINNIGLRPGGLVLIVRVKFRAGMGPAADADG